MASPFLGEIKMFAGNFAPKNYAFCSGQLLSISQNSALFSLLGTNYGGNGTSNFALPNLQGRVPIGAGNGAGLSSYVQGQSGGTENHTLSISEIPAHSHSLIGSSAAAGSGSPGGNVLAASRLSVYSAAGSLVNLAPQAIAPAGSNQPHNNLQPYLAISFIIALQGIFPARN